MPTYITLVQYTGEGIANMKESPDRLQRAREIATEHGGELSQFFLTMGEYDAVAVSTYPDDASYAKAMLTIAQGGAVQTETLTAFTEDEYRDICDAL
ncbi:GYD domain-containing protein [Salinigranum sp. GCM10025319]|uniref:GYD domain-containing protein n=1 Tax=Salinigranum sp. GCM10025319 TaxID=3252687 RepID=UPI003614DB21